MVVGIHLAIHAIDKHPRFQLVWCANGFLFEFALIYPTYAIMMQTVGISAVELSVLFVIWSASAFAFEVPSGLVADKYSRKRVLIAGAVIKGAAFVVWLASPTFLGFSTGFVIWGLGSSLVSGTSQAYLHDYLAERGLGGLFEKIYGRETAARNLGVVLALLLGGAAADYGGYAVPLVLSAASLWLGAALVAALLPAVSGLGSVDTGVRRASLSGTLREGIDETGASPALLTIVLALALLAGIPGHLEEYFGPLLAEPEVFSLTAIGVVYAFIWGAPTLALTQAHRLKQTRLSVGILGFTMFSSFALIPFLWYPHWAAVVALTILGIAGALINVLLQGQMQRSIQGHARATITSFAAMGTNGFGIFVYLSVGAIAAASSWAMAFSAFGLVIALIGSVLCFRATRLEQ